jgi:MFS family permease
MINIEFKKTLFLAWPLFMGLSMIMMGNGLQGTLLGLKADHEGFPVYATGIVMSMYYVGFLLGCYVVPKMISSVGHIRVFASLASIASVIILLHGVFIDLWVWGVIRILSGMSFAGLFIVAESWLNSITTNKLRAQVFGFYLFIIHSGLLMGQFLLNLGSIESMDLFVLVSVLISLSILPLTLANNPSPGYSAPEKLPLKDLIKSSPLSLSSVFVSGFCAGTIFGIGAVYAAEIGLSKSQTAIFMATYILGSALIPLIIGWISDKIDRRKAIIALSLAACLCSLAINTFSIKFPFMFLLGGLITSIYSIGLAYMNDNLKPEQAVSASTSLILLNGMGATLGPLVSGMLMDFIAPDAFFYGFAVTLFCLFLFGIYRATVGNKVIIKDQTLYTPIPPRAAPTIMKIREDQ